MKIKMIAVIAALLLALGLVVVVMAQTATPSPAAAQNAPAPTNFGELIAQARASDKAITFDFTVPLVTGERVWTLPDDTAKRTISSIGNDYVCFSERWNDGYRQRCTPFSNITSITFLD